MEGTYQKFSDICTGYVGRGRSKLDTAITGKRLENFHSKILKSLKKGIRYLYKIFIVQKLELLLVLLES